MKNFRLKTTLAVEPRCDGCSCRSFITIRKSASAILSYDLSNKEYIVDYDEDGNLDFQNFKIVIKQPNGSMSEYSYYSEEGLIDEGHFSYDRLLNRIDFSLSAAETAVMQASDADAPTLWEVTIITRDGYTIIEPQTPIIVLGSLYNRSQGYDSEVGLCDSTTLCSSSIACGE